MTGQSSAPSNYRFNVTIQEMLTWTVEVEALNQFAAKAAAEAVIEDAGLSELTLIRNGYEISNIEVLI